MKDKMQYYVLKEKAVPEVLLKVVEAKRLIDSGKIASVQEATESVGISRSSFYKYKDDIFPFHETTKGKTITMVIQMDDEPGLLSGVLKTIADFHANILTIHQSLHNTKTERQNKNDKSSNYGVWNDRFRCGRGFRHQ